MKAKVSKLEQAVKPKSTPAKPKADKPARSKALTGKLSRTCRNWNLGLW